MYKSKRIASSLPSHAAARVSLVAALFAASLSLFAPCAAFASDEVSLRNGGLLRGEILILQPGEKVVILVPGEDKPRTIPWSEINDVVPEERGKPTPTPTPTPSGGSAPPPSGYDHAITDDDPGAVRVHIDSKGQHASLMVVLDTMLAVVDGKHVHATQYMPVCETPCDKVIDTTNGKKFFFDGDDMPKSQQFSLDTYGKDVIVDVDPGSHAAKGWAAAMTIAGGLGVLGGAAVLLVSVDEEPDLVAAGGVSMGLGAGLLVAGIVVLVESATDVSVKPRYARNGSYQARAPRFWLGEF